MKLRVTPVQHDRNRFSTVNRFVLFRSSWFFHSFQKRRENQNIERLKMTFNLDRVENVLSEMKIKTFALKSFTGKGQLTGGGTDRGTGKRMDRQTGGQRDRRAYKRRDRQTKGQA